MQKQQSSLRWFNLLTFLLVIAVNALANILPINGITTGEVSDAYPNLFAPAPITFSIWGLIYLLLALFILFQIGVFGKQSGQEAASVKRIGMWFGVSSLVNTAWIFCWHYQIISATLVLMLLLVTALITIYQRIVSEALTQKEKLFVKLPFSIYFGWVTVAAIANVTTWNESIRLMSGMYFSFCPFSGTGQ